MSLTNTNMLRIEQVSERTGVPVATLRYWRYQGTGPASFRLGRRVVYDAAEIERWINEQRRHGGAPAA